MDEGDSDYDEDEGDVSLDSNDDDLYSSGDDAAARRKREQAQIKELLVKRQVNRVTNVVEEA